jgi:nitrate reductase NapAB chaperone NapD
MQAQSYEQKTAKVRTTTAKRQIFAYTLMRSVSSPRLLNVCAVDKKGGLIVVVESDLEFDDAVEQVEKLNSELN